MKSIFLIPILPFIVFFSSCTKFEDCPRYFQIKAKIVPQKDEYHVGDTITVVSKFHRQVTAFNSEQDEIGTFDMKGIKWKPISVIYRIDTIAHQDNPLFSVVNTDLLYLFDSIYDYEIFESSTFGNSLLGEYNYSGDSFDLEYKFVCLNVGIFLLEHSSLVEAGAGEPQDFPGICKRTGSNFDVWVEMNLGINNNVHLLKESPDPHWNSWFVNQEKDRNLFSELGGFCFRVVP